jgi:hypothetical protein
VTPPPSTYGRAVFVQVHRVAEALSLSPRTVQHYCATGVIPASRVGKQWLVPVAYLRSLLRA